MPRKNVQLKAIVANQWKPENKGDRIEGTIVNQFQKVLTDTPVPFLQVVDDSGEITEIIMGTYALEKLYYSGACQTGNYLIIQYDGEHPTIKNANNHLKMFSYYLEDETGHPLVIPTQVEIGGIDPYGLNVQAESSKPKNKVQTNMKKRTAPHTDDVDFEQTVDEQNKEEKATPDTK